MRGVLLRRRLPALRAELKRAKGWPTHVNNNFQRRLHSMWVSSREGTAPLQATLDTQTCLS
jgi:hypothetical protein